MPGGQAPQFRIKQSEQAVQGGRISPGPIPQDGRNRFLGFIFDFFRFYYFAFSTPFFWG
jgi:hypothetical protein